MTGEWVITNWEPASLGGLFYGNLSEATVEHTAEGSPF
jgi:hypothetical protein